MYSKRFFLVGPMGAGKSTIGRQLAKRFDLPFIDIDNEIENVSGADIQWIFDKEGEYGFRLRESKVLRRSVESNTKAVIATGGGIVLNEENRLLISSAGIVIYLSVTKQQLYERIKRDRKRPLLQVEDRQQAVNRLFDERDPLYRQIADVIFSSSNTQVQRVVDELERELDHLELGCRN